MKYFVLVIFFLLISCDPIPEESDSCHREIAIMNKSLDELLVFEGTSLETQVNCNSLFTIIDSSSVGKIPSTLTSCWEELILVPNVFDGAIALYYTYTLIPPCDSITLNANIIDRREYTIEDLDSLNWTIKYP